MQIDANGITIAYEDRGSGIPLVLIHGYPLNRGMWAPQVEGLTGAERILAPDLRGQGESQQTPAPYSMELFADDLAAFLDALGIHTPVVLGGLSMGGYVALAFFRKYRQRLAGLILAATRASADAPQARENRQKGIEMARSQGVSAIVASMLPNILSPVTYRAQPELVEQVRKIMLSASAEGLVGALMGMRDRPDSVPLLAEIDLPVLIVRGADDQFIPAEENQQMRAALRRASLEVIPEAGHLPNLEQPALFNRAVTRFLQQFEGQSLGGQNL